MKRARTDCRRIQPPIRRLDPRELARVAGGILASDDWLDPQLSRNDGGVTSHDDWESPVA